VEAPDLLSFLTVRIGGRMADRILALAGKGVGPNVYTANLGDKVRAKVVGLVEGCCVLIKGDGFEQRLESNGSHELPNSVFMSAEYHGESFMICTLHAG